MTWNRPYAWFIGRYQPFHDGHAWLIDQQLHKGNPVLVCVRCVEQGPDNPRDPMWVVEDIRERYMGRDVTVMLVPDIASINYGRGVGYQIIQHIPPTHIAEISATKIRDRERAERKNA